MNDDTARNVTDRSRISRRSLNRMLLGGSAGLVALTESAAALGKAESPTPSAVEDRLAIEELIYRCAMAIDSLDKDALADCFAPSAREPKGLDWVIDYHRNYEHTMHNILNHVCTVRESTATGVTYAVASMVKRGDNGLTKFDVYFYYHDELVKQDQHWFISKRQLTLVFSSEATPVQPGAPLLGLSMESMKPGSLRMPPVLNYLKT